MVYGFPAIVTAINIYSTCLIDSLEENVLILELKNYDSSIIIKDISQVFSILPEKHNNLSLAVEYLSKTYDLDFRNVKITLSSDLMIPGSCIRL
mgnify:CR=1 FL=1